MTWSEHDIPDQTGRTVIVTGANSGIGFETARALAAKGARVVLACRDDVRGRDAVRRILDPHPDAQVELSSLDLSRLASVQTFARRHRERHGALDVLVNNAGVMMPPYTRTDDGFELQFGVNHLGHFALTARLFDLLGAAEGGRVVTVSSVAHRFGAIEFDDLAWERRYKKTLAYAQSKLANLLFTHELQRRLQAAGSTVRGLAAHPGWTATDLQRTSWLFRTLNPLFGQSPADGALPTLRAATDPDAEPGSYWGPSGFQELRGAPVPVKAHPRAHDEATARRLWEVSEQLTGVDFALN